MANVVIALDRDLDRRKRFLASARSRIAPLPDLVVATREGEGWAAVWAAGPSAPTSIESDGLDGTFVWGDAIDPRSGSRLKAKDVKRRWSQDDRESWDGFHLVLDVSGSGELAASVDLMGLLPLYHWQGADVVLVGTSVDAFHAHPSFRASLDVAGLAGILLMNGQLGGRTLWTGVRRLGVRRQLRLRAGVLSEVETFGPGAPDPALLALPLEGHVEVMHQALVASMKRMVQPGEPHGLLLSGGLDSRQLGGYLLDRGIVPEALTFGRDADIEMRCARKVAKALGARHLAVEIEPAEYGPAAERLAKFEGLAAGFGNVLDWTMVPHLGKIPSKVVVGHAFDGVVGGIHIPWAFDPASKAYSFDTVFRRFNRWGFSPDALREILVPESKSVVEEVLGGIRASFHDTSDLPNLQAWHFDLQTRQRFHVGGAVWPMTFRSWPVSPIFDREVFRIAESMPASSISGRRLQRELLIDRHPHLASIPLDRNSFDSLPPNPALLDHLATRVTDLWRRLQRRLAVGGPGRERRFYYRTYDFQSPGWSVVRAQGETSRQDIPVVLRSEVVNDLLPGHGHPFQADDGIIDSSRAKLLLGLAMTSRSFQTVDVV